MEIPTLYCNLCYDAISGELDETTKQWMPECLCLKTSGNLLVVSNVQCADVHICCKCCKSIYVNINAIKATAKKFYINVSSSP